MLLREPVVIERRFNAQGLSSAPVEDQLNLFNWLTLEYPTPFQLSMPVPSPSERVNVPRFFSAV